MVKENKKKDNQYWLDWLEENNKMCGMYGKMQY